MTETDFKTMDIFELNNIIDQYFEIERLRNGGKVENQESSVISDGDAFLSEMGGV
ncbi:hypothetical protein [Culicoidibacter larvae]|uniref:hypothetical protein n=1 Tax=Culicoidibacter larvae TaxID=2579976 RepID=UPI001484DCB9|nr:hypothetical protein [Culicoidibacter larvae]